MRTALTMAICSIISSTSFGSTDDIIALRKLYYLASSSKSSTEKLVDCLKDVTLTSDALLQGYKGMSFLLTAKHGWNPINKLSDFKEGITWLESSIKKDPNNIELRFLRYSVQINAPSFLEYSNSLKNDKNFIVKNYEQLIDIDLKTRISNYLSQENNIN